MSHNTFGHLFRVTTFGESHGPAIGCVVDGTFGQGDSPVTVERMSADGEIHDEETGCFGINLHRGGVNGTSSEGCLTVTQEQWKVFHYYLTLALDKAGMKSFPLILIEGPIS